MLFYVFRCLNQNKRTLSISPILFPRSATSSKQLQNKIQTIPQQDNNKIILVSQSLHEHLFGKNSASPEQIAQMERRKPGEECLVEEKLKLPQLWSNSLMGHFKALADEQLKE